MSKRIALLILVLLAMISFSSCSAREQVTEEGTGEYTTIVGKDKEGITLPDGGSVDLWASAEIEDRVYTEALFVAKVKDGERVELLDRTGDRVKVKTKAGKIGWLGCHLVAKYRDECLDKMQ